MRVGKDSVVSLEYRLHLGDGQVIDQARHVGTDGDTGAHPGQSGELAGDEPEVAHAGGQRSGVQSRALDEDPGGADRPQQQVGDDRGAQCGVVIAQGDHRGLSSCP